MPTNIQLLERKFNDGSFSRADLALLINAIKDVSKGIGYDGGPIPGSGGGGGGTATSIVNTPAGNIIAINVQDALNELDAEKTSFSDLTTIQSGLQTNIDLKANLYPATDRKTADYTLVLTDVGKTIEMNVASANILTIPLASSVPLPINTCINIDQYGIGITTITPASGVTLNSSSTGYTTTGQNSGVVLRKIATNEWRLYNGVIPGANITTLQVYLSPLGTPASTAQVSGAQPFPNGGAILQKFDATSYNFIRIGIRLVTVGASTARCYPVYDTNLGTISYNVIGAGTVVSGEAISYASIGSENGWFVTSWIALPAGAKADVYFGINEIGGNGVASPAYTLGYIQFK